MCIKIIEKLTKISTRINCNRPGCGFEHHFVGVDKHCRNGNFSKYCTNVISNMFGYATILYPNQAYL